MNIFNKLFLTSFFLLSFFSCSKNKKVNTIPLEVYKNEILNLKTQKDINEYWDKLYHLDQITYLKETKTIQAGDSISVANMIRVALMIEIHGIESYTPNVNAPWVVHAHNYISKTSLAYWPIIEQLRTNNNGKNPINEDYPNYYLEGIALNFYDYSLYNQNDIYDELIRKINSTNYDNVSYNLYKLYSEYLSFQDLNTKETIGIWQRQHFKNVKDESLGNFEILKMSDNNIYIKTKGRLRLLKLVDTKQNSKLYKVDGEPFNWNYKLTNTGDLSLQSDKEDVLINYNKASHDNLK
jgi:hypothetical protein